MVASSDGQMDGAALLHHVAWQDFMVVSIIDGSDEALKALFVSGVEVSRELGCNAIGLVHPDCDEMIRRQELFGLHNTGSITVQLIHEI